MSSIRTLLITLLTIVASCSAAHVVAPLPVSELQETPGSIAVGGQTLVLSPSLWRDFQPISPPDGKPLVVIVHVQAADGAVLRASFHVDAAWIVNGTEVWAASVGEERLASPSPVYHEAIARDGPKWGPGIRVDVVVRIREESGATQLVRAAGQLIQRTD